MIVSPSAEILAPERTERRSGLALPMAASLALHCAALFLCLALVRSEFVHTVPSPRTETASLPHNSAIAVELEFSPARRAGPADNTAHTAQTVPAEAAAGEPSVVELQPERPAPVSSEPNRRASARPKKRRARGVRTSESAALAELPAPVSDSSEHPPAASAHAAPEVSEALPDPEPDSAPENAESWTVSEEKEAASDKAEDLLASVRGGTSESAQQKSSGALASLNGTSAGGGVGSGRNSGGLGQGQVMGVISDDVRRSVLKRLSSAAERCYPRQARRRGIQGVSAVRFCISETGSASEFRLIQSSGSSILDEASSCVVESASPFEPFTRGRCLQVPIRFVLR